MVEVIVAPESTDCFEEIKESDTDDQVKFFTWFNSTSSMNSVVSYSAIQGVGLKNAESLEMYDWLSCQIINRDH